MDTFTPQPVDNCYHVYSDGTRLAVLCNEDNDYVMMMNLIAVVAYYCCLHILSLEVMTTHFHVVLRGDAKMVTKYVKEIKRLVVRHFRRDGMPERVINSIRIQADPILDNEELRRKIIYVFRNCTEAGYPFLPEDYPWGPGVTYCHPIKSNPYRKVSGLTYREQCRLFRTRVKLPGDWEYDDKGMLVPGSYLDHTFLKEMVFLTPRQFIAFLNVKKRDLAEMEMADARPFMEQKKMGKLVKQVEQMSMNQFGTTVGRLPQANKITLAFQLWEQDKTLTVKQLHRLTRVNEDVLRSILHIQKKP